jgi:hypothetical protein
MLVDIERPADLQHFHRIKDHLHFAAAVTLDLQERRRTARPWLRLALAAGTVS